VTAATTGYYGRPVGLARASMLLLLDLGLRHQAAREAGDWVRHADLGTSLADARAALNIETGTELDVIDPATGLARFCLVQWCGCGRTRQLCGSGGTCSWP
jgi:hypothetical protein